MTNSRLQKNYWLCADDFGQNTAISDAIIELCELNKLNATSCMTNLPYWPTASARLSSLPSHIKIGVHLNLTEGSALTSAGKKTTHSLAKLLLLSQCRQLNQRHIETEFYAQLVHFMETTSREPDFIDGHQHIHQFPVIRNALLNVYQRLFPHRRITIRVPGSPGRAAFNSVKASILTATGTPALRRQLIKHKIPHNTTFAGIYDFRQSAHYADLFPRFFDAIKEDGIIMCHPGHPSSDEDDPIALARVNEYQYLKSMTEFLPASLKQHQTACP